MDDFIKKYLESPRALLSPDPSRPLDKQNKVEDTIPYGWGTDELTSRLEDAQKNIRSTYHKYGKLFNEHLEVIAIFKKITDNLNITEDNITQLFLLDRTWSSFFAAIRLVSSGQIPESYVLQRNCLEYSLYAYYMTENPDSILIWLNRHDNEPSKKRCRNIFSIGNIFKCLGKKDKVTCSIVREFYEHSIDYGAHPNEKGVIRSIVKNPDGYTVSILETNDSPPMKIALIEILRAGLCSIDIFKYVFPDTYSQLGINDWLKEKMKKV